MGGGQLREYRLFALCVAFWVEELRAPTVYVVSYPRHLFNYQVFFFCDQRGAGPTVRRSKAMEGEVRWRSEAYRLYDREFILGIFSAASNRQVDVA